MIKIWNSTSQNDDLQSVKQKVEIINYVDWTDFEFNLIAVKLNRASIMKPVKLKSVSLFYQDMQPVCNGH